MIHRARIYYFKQPAFRPGRESSPTDIEPRLFAPFGASLPRDRTHSQLHQLKRKLLHAALKETPETGLFKQLRGAANQAAHLAWATSHPLLVFPHLFDEMVAAVREQFQQEQVSDVQSPFASLDADLRFEDVHPVAQASDPAPTLRSRWPPDRTATRGDRNASQNTQLSHVE